MKKLLILILKKIGLQLKRFPDYDTRRRLLIINQNEIDVIFDIGANKGQFGREMRSLGFTGKIISFEPILDAFEILSSTSSNDKKWIVNNYALGSENTNGTINVAKNSASSSIQEMLPKHLEVAPFAKYITKNEIEIKKLDDVYHEFCDINEVKMLKIDTQGYEKNVLEGAIKILEEVSIIQLEMSLTPLYSNQILINDMIHYLNIKGFELFSVENGFCDPKTGQLLQVDGIFTKKSN